MPRSIAGFVIVLTLVATAAAQRRPSTAVNVPKELNVRITYESGEPVEMGIRVQLTTGAGTPFAETFTDDRGTARFVIDAGSYRLRITGANIEETASERSFVIDTRETNHSEFVSVRRKPGQEEGASLETHISAAMLQIPGKAKSEYEKGVKALVKKEYDEARKRFEKAANMYPKYAAAFNGLGVVAMNTGEPEAGRNFFQKAIEADPEHPAALVNMSKILIQDKNYPEGESLLTKAVTLDPLNPEAVSLLAYFQLHTGKMNAAIRSAERAHKMPHEKFAMVHFIAASAHEQQHQIPDAIREYKMFLQESPADTPTAQKVKTAIAALETKNR
jgi:tetratricopeptide (TPR) repeat protein